MILKHDEFNALDEINRKSAIAENVPFTAFDFEILTINKASNEVEILILY